MRCRTRSAVLLTIVAVMLSGSASAQTTDVPPQSIRVTGEATVTAAPDQAEVDIAVMTRASTAAAAAEQNARQIATVLAEVKKRLGPEDTTRTVGYSVQPEYRYPREGREPEISGYVATNVIRITTSNLKDVGQFVDVAIGAGANRVQRMRFSLKDEQAVYANALRQAASRAQGEANALAAALGLTVVRVISAAEESAQVRPFVDVARTATLAAESTTPVEPGTVDVEARVVLTVEVAGAR